MPTQLQIFYKEQRKLADANTTFLELVREGMTREELQTNIDRRPSLWGRFSNFVDQLPSSLAPAALPSH
ncbi:MAG: hypothetical protein Q7S87_01180 [Agitococcus sp.]|nr:hypothetical protein [Agitococcus sp.]MDO9179138.1 hypothetical protein [Agitococcus sp.]